MGNERRYRDDEVRDIFELAAHREVASLPVREETDGLTLSELQSIGREVGLDPAAVADAATALESRAASLPRRTSFGMPVGVGRLVALPRPLTDAEWERLVAELRSTFGARGKLSSHGGLREWSNGNLHACMEPSDTGYRLRLGTVKGNAVVLNAMGATGLVAGALSGGALLISGSPEALFGPMMIGASGFAALLANTLRLPMWVTRRQEQMNHVASRVHAIMNESSHDGDPVR